MSFSSQSGSSDTTSQSKAKQKGTSQNDPWAPTIPYQKDMLGMLGAAGGIGLSGDQKAAYETLKTNALQGNPWAGNLAAGADDLYNQAQQSKQLSGQLHEGLDPYLRGDYLDPTQNPGFTDAMERAQRDVYNKINSAFAGAGRNITGNAAGQRAVGEGIADVTARNMLDQFNKQQGYQLQALGMAPQTINAANSAAGTQYAQMGQMADAAIKANNYGAERLIDLDNMMNSEAYNDLALVANILFGAGSQGGQSSFNTTGSQSGTSHTDSSSSGFGFSLFSDRRLKTDIKLVGRTFDGMNIYSYRYQSGGPTMIGLMAQEVAMVKPDAVGEIGGMLTVDYKKATADA